MEKNTFTTSKQDGTVSCQMADFIWMKTVNN